jgi:hypothetical protein
MTLTFLAASFTTLSHRACGAPRGQPSGEADGPAWLRCSRCRRRRGGSSSPWSCPWTTSTHTNRRQRPGHRRTATAVGRRAARAWRGPAARARTRPPHGPSSCPCPCWRTWPRWPWPPCSSGLSSAAARRERGVSAERRRAHAAAAQAATIFARGRSWVRGFDPTGRASYFSETGVSQLG